MNVGNFVKRRRIQPSILLIAVLVLFLSTIVYIFSGCTIAGKTYTESNNGDDLNLKVNDTITIKLESNATTGYKWNLFEENNSGIITMISSGYTEKENKDNLVGAGGFETFSFKAISRGNTTITLTYNRQWEKDVQPEKIFKLNISVK
jgi:inhibitor of cysteine peptidase